MYQALDIDYESNKDIVDFVVIKMIELLNTPEGRNRFDIHWRSTRRNTSLEDAQLNFNDTLIEFFSRDYVLTLTERKELYIKRYYWPAVGLLALLVLVGFLVSK